MNKGKRRGKDQARILEEIIPKKNIITDFSFDTVWVSARTKSGFTCFLKNSDEYYKMNYSIMKKILPILKNHDFSNVGESIKILQYQGLKHSHLVEGENLIELKAVLINAYQSYKGVVSSDAEDAITQNMDGKKIYQIGLSSIRMFGYFTDNIFTVLLVDYHHLIYPDANHNDKDYKQFKFCPIVEGA